MPDNTPLAEFRRKSGKSPAEIGKMFGVDRATVYRWERGEPPIPVKHLERIEAITGISRQDLRPDLAGIFGERS